jgi:hypothetical protein
MRKRSESKSKKEQVESTKQPKSTQLFDSANKDRPIPPLPNLKKGFHEVVTDIFDTGYDVLKEYKAIEDSLSIKNALTPGNLQDDANKKESIARRASQLYVIGKVEYEAYVRETDSIVGAMRDGATNELEKEKAQKIRTKQITEADVKEYAAKMYPDEWEDVNNRRDRAKYMLSHLENLMALTKSRCYTVSNMLNPNSKIKL